MSAADAAAVQGPRLARDFRYRAVRFGAYRSTAKLAQRDGVAVISGVAGLVVRPMCQLDSHALAQASHSRMPASVIAGRFSV